MDVRSYRAFLLRQKRWRNQTKMRFSRALHRLTPLQRSLRRGKRGSLRATHSRKPMVLVRSKSLREAPRSWGHCLLLRRSRSLIVTKRLAFSIGEEQEEEGGGGGRRSADGRLLRCSSCEEGLHQYTDFGGRIALMQRNFGYFPTIDFSISLRLALFAMPTLRSNLGPEQRNRPLPLPRIKSQKIKQTVPVLEQSVV
ncbi:hypothetical protein SprV_0100458300 [Sparganum proliferum]